jgi:hypothetical protein
MSEYGDSQMDDRQLVDNDRPRLKVYTCTLCGDLAEFREDEQVWRHAGNSQERGLMVPGEGCDKYGYPIKVRAVLDAAKERG